MSERDPDRIATPEQGTPLDLAVKEGMTKRNLPERDYLDRPVLIDL